MEERAVGGKEKKYVLYTVVGEEKEKATLGVWAVRILLGTLLLVALAVVPYVSLRLAQVSDRTLVVFQQVPLHNRSGLHHRASGLKGVHHRPLESASLLKSVHNASSPSSSNQTLRSLTNSTLVTLHESAVTLSLLEDTSPSNTSRTNKNFTDSPQVEHQSEESASSDEIANSTSSSFVESGAINETKEPEEEIDSEESVTNDATEETKLPSQTKGTPISETSSKIDLSTTTRPSTFTQNPKITPNSTTIVSSKIVSTLKSATRPVLLPSDSSSTQKPVTHKLAYVATAASGNHVGGFCVWKTNKNVTNWKYFFENIPIEYQSHQDNVDHEFRGMLAAVRLWYNQWHDYHVVLRSQNQAISKSKHPTRKSLLGQLEESSEGHFTYELEWSLRKDDPFVEIAYCLARLYRDYDYWYDQFELKVDELLGAQDWSSTKESRRMEITKKLFQTGESEESNGLGDLSSLHLF